MRPLRVLLPLLLALCAGPAPAQAVITSAAPEEIHVTVYRAPGTSIGSDLDLDWLDGYALVSETRRVSVPEGESELRFEGVAGGIQPQSAIIRGFPDGIIERNHDAYLLSPGTLLDRSLGRRVHLRRTSRATGASVEQEAVIRSGADGAVVLQTQAGFEALRCTGLAETLVYSEVPAGLSAKPTLSVRIRSARAVTATVTLSYLSSGFDWRANYIAKLSPDGGHVDLFAWLTLASSDDTSFRDAHAQAVAGRLNREEVDRQEAEARPLFLRCWPQGRTSDLPSGRIAGIALQRNSAIVVDSITAEDLGQLPDENIIVSGSRTRREDLGDLKLYRIEEPVTIAAHSQKQVAFLEQDQVQVSTVYRQRLDAESAIDAEPAIRYLLSRNRSQEGLGLPLPAGRVQLFAQAGGRPILLGEGVVDDKAVGEEVEIALGEAPAVIAGVENIGSGDNWDEFRLTVTNSQPVPIAYEAEFDLGEDRRIHPKARLSRRDGRPLWRTTVPANGRATFQFRVVETNG
jgi:hypothetical protein